MCPPPDNESLAIKQTMPSAGDMECPASQPQPQGTAPQSTASASSFLKRRHDDTFDEDSTEEEETSSSKKPRSRAPEVLETSPSKKSRSSGPKVLPLIRHLTSPKKVLRKRIHGVSDRNRKRKIAGERSLVQSFRKKGLLQATTLSNITVKKKNPVGMALGPSNYDNPSEYLLALPIAQTPDLWDVSEAEEPDPIKYAVVEDGQYRFDLTVVAFELLDEVLREEAAHMKWIEEVNRSILADIEEYVELNPKYVFISERQRSAQIFVLARRKEDRFIEQWCETCKGIPFEPIEEDSMEKQVSMAIAKAAYFNPLPVNMAEYEIEEFVESVQRIGFEYHRAHNRKWLYLWKEKVKKWRKKTGQHEEEEEQEQEPETGGSPTTSSGDDIEAIFGSSPPELSLPELL